MLIFNELPVAFPWFDKLEKQARYKENVDKVCDFKLITPKNSVLPFEFRRPTLPGVIPVKWEIVEVNSDIAIRNVSSSLQEAIGNGDLRTKTADGYDYYYFNGEELTTSDLLLSTNPIPYGFYYCLMTFSDASTYISEVFHVPANAFSVDEFGEIANLSTMQYLRLTWWNNCDIKPIFYNDLEAGESYFKQRLYLDTFITAAEPEIQIDGTKDGNDVTIPTFQRASIKHRISLVTYDYVKIALTILSMHERLQLTTPKGIHHGDIEKIAVSSTVEPTGAYSTVEILFEQDLAVVNKACCDNYAIPECEADIPEITEVVADGSDVTITGTANAGGWVEIYGSSGGVGYNFIKTITAAQFASGHEFANTGGAAFFLVISRNNNCVFGESEPVEL